jgi:hypothetical protein
LLGVERIVNPPDNVAAMPTLAECVTRLGIYHLPVAAGGAAAGVDPAGFGKLL